MASTEQQRTIDFLLEPETHGRQPVRHITTSLSELFLVGDDAYKLKRALKRAYVDFSTPDKRREVCEREVALNRRTAPSLYLGVVPITQNEDGLALDGTGDAIDYLVHMRRFDEDTLFHTLAEQDALDDRTIIHLADQLADFHKSLTPETGRGGAKSLATAIEKVVRSAVDQDGPLTSEIKTIWQDWQAALKPRAARLDARSRHGYVRQCHGDLHLANICLVDGEPTMFDCIEFNDDIACIDMAYDIAFPVMDLVAHGQTGRANLLLNRYLSVTQDFHAAPLMPVLLAARAIVRACVKALEAEADEAALDKAHCYLKVAQAVLAPSPARLVAIGGRSGTGKSTLARRIAPLLGPPPGALWLRTDLLRKVIMGVKPEEKLGDEGYSTAVTKQTYNRMMRVATRALNTGVSVLLDGVFLKEFERRDAEHAARHAGTSLEGLWLEAPLEARSRRADDRTGDPSDADAEIAKMQERIDAGAIDWTRIDTSQSLEETVGAARKALKLSEPA